MSRKRQGNRIWRERCFGIGTGLPPPLAGEGWGEGISATGQSPRGENPHPAPGTMLRIARTPASGRGCTERAAIDST
ncbi:hypothetical protein EGT07_29145 [Herbaspirillum sp. HC18]|nr:hypothetical protein EGT07_29145 [Herbaspirillum sp. HC18]